MLSNIHCWTPKVSVREGFMEVVAFELNPDWWIAFWFLLFVFFS